MITLIGLGLLIYLLVQVSSLSARVKELELRQGTAGVPEKVPGMTLKDARAYGPDNEHQLAQIEESSYQETNKASLYYEAPPSKFILWLKEDWLMKLGAALFIIGFGWFISYAFINNWIGPIGRISIGIVAGAGMMAFGFRRMISYSQQGAVFMALGAGMAMLTIFAGRSIYGFFTPFSAIAFDFLIVAFVSFASYKFNLKPLAYVAQALAFIAPLLAAGQTNSVFLFSYLLFISIATLFLAGITGWRKLISSSLIFVGLYSIPYIMGYSHLYAIDAPIILNFAYLFSMLYLWAGMSAVIRKGVDDPLNEIALAVMNGLFLFLWIQSAAPSEWSSLIFAAWAVVFAASSFVAYRFSARPEPFYAYGSVAVAFLAAGTAIELKGADLVIAFAMEAMLLVFAVLHLTKDPKKASMVAAVFMVPVALSVSSMSGYANSYHLFSIDFFALVIMALALVSAGHALRPQASEEEEQEVNTGSVLVLLGTFYVGYIIWHFMHIWMMGEPDIATMITLVIFTILGLIAYFAGLYGNDIARRTYGAGLLAFVAIRLVFIDVWNMDLFGRVVTFLAIGILLMSTAFLTKRKKPELTPGELSK